MKRLIAGIVAGLVLGSGVATAGTAYYWSEKGRGYACEGETNGVICTAGKFDVGVTKDYVFIQHRVTEHLFACRKRVSTLSACIEG